ncbi:hypothetical protein T07_589 [Trichinella nelsoni]|uniref:Uncharacterized protein n=1 Tax=Trichinella nelsoni TaxID=6336 RepID=A0A0V0RBZ0_9BILA|nr:hypothetical protein T07_589 [Trichinella nelsoni]
MLKQSWARFEHLKAFRREIVREQYPVGSKDNAGGVQLICQSTTLQMDL